MVSHGELYAVDVQRHSEVHRPPRVRLPVGVHTRTSGGHVYAIVSVVGVTGDIRTARISERADLVCRTVESNVHVEASLCRHCASPLRWVS